MMSDLVDEDVLSLQLESSLSLLEDEDDYISESKSDQDLKREDSEVKKNLLESISTLQTPIKISNKDLRKKVLIRSMHTPKLDMDKTDSKTDENKGTNHEEKKDEELIKRESKECGTESKHSSSSNSTKGLENLDIDDILSQDYIVIDEFVDVSSPQPEKEDPVKKVQVTEKIERKRGLEVDYVSKDPLENADNNNPDWLLLQKLETDEERYKAVRERWRNLIVPEPNKDLTCFVWCRKGYTGTQHSREDMKRSESEEEGQFKGRKRTFSSSEIESPRRGRQRDNSEKRVRTLSCTRVYDEKIAALRRHVSDECLKIDKEQKKALEELNDNYVQERRSLSTWSLNTGVSLSATLSDLDEYHYHQRRNIQRSYENLSLKFLEKQNSQIRSLEDASAEVLAFHRFYQGLDQCAPEAMALTEEQSQEIDEINHMYDTFYKFYEE